MNDSIYSAKKRLDWIDKAKGLAILGIVFFHFFQNYPHKNYWTSLLAQVGAKIGFASVDIFFVIAGFNTSYALISKLKDETIDFEQINWILWLRKRLFRLYPAYWLAILLSLLLYYFLGRIEVKSITDFILILLGIPDYARFKTINPGFWFFSVILQAYLVIPLIFYLCSNQIKLVLLLGILGGLATKIACLVSYGNPDVFWFLLQNNFLGSYFFPLCLGLYWGWVYYYYQGFRNKDWLASIIIFVIGLIIYGLMFLLKINDLYMLGFDILFTPFIMLLCYWICEHVINLIPKVREWISGLGVNSYQIYLIHQPILFLIVPKINLKNPISFPLEILFYLIIFASVLSIYVMLFLKLESWLITSLKKPLKL